MKKNIAVVIPTIRNLDFLKFWKNEFKECIGIIIEDHPQKEIRTPSNYFKQVCHYSWKEIDEELGKDSWIIQRKNSGIRNFGFLKAWQLKADTTITLDDDCYPVKNQDFVKQHLTNLSFSAPEDWMPTYPHKKYFYTRGIPYSVREKREVALSHGLWTNILDFDAKTYLKLGKLNTINSVDFMQFIPQNYFFPMCSMNLAFKTKITPIMYFPLMGSDKEGKLWGYDRFDDIWAGILAKKILDHLNYSAVNGSPFVEHKQASNVLENLKKEKKGMKVNETFYKLVQKVELKSDNLMDAYLELFEKVKLPEERYFKKLKEAAKIWIKLIKA